MISLKFYFYPFKMLGGVNVKKSLIEKIAVGDNFTVLLKEDGTLWKRRKGVIK